MRQKSDLRPYQDRAVTTFYETNAVQAVMPMGSGKTVCALTAVRELIDDGVIRRALVLAPKRVAQLVWPREVNEWAHLKGLRVQLVAGTPAERMRALTTEADVHVVGIDNIQWLVELLAKTSETNPVFDCLIFDELSRLKNPRSKRARALRKVSKRFKIKWGLTGTPRPNGWEDQFGPLTLLSDAKLWGKSFDAWRNQRFMALDFHGRNWTIRPEWRDRTLADVQSMSFTVDPNDMPELPELTTVIHWVDLPRDAKARYKDMEAKLVTQFKEGKLLAGSRAIATGKLAQIANGFLYGEDGSEDVEWLHAEKADLLVELVEERNDNPTLIAYEFVQQLKELRTMWEGLPYLGAGVSDKAAEAHERDWNARKLPVLALHPASAGHGLNLQHGGNTIIWFGLTWSAELYDQTLKRFHRSGQTERCFNHLILARDTVDEMKYDRVVQKMTDQEAFNRYLRRV